MPRLIAALVRHGDYHQLPRTPSAHQPFPLNDAGVAQAREAAGRLGQVLSGNAWVLEGCVDSSRLLRAWQTAQLICEQLPPPSSGGPVVESFDALAERGLGSAANLTVDQIEQVLRTDPRYDPPPPGWKSNSRYRLPLQGAESLLEAGERVAGHLRARMTALRGVARGDTLKLFVGHGAAFRHAAHHLGVLEFDQIARLSMFHGSPLLIEFLANGSWRHVGGEWKQRSRGSQAMD